MPKTLRNFGAIAAIFFAMSSSAGPHPSDAYPDDGERDYDSGGNGGGSSNGGGGLLVLLAIGAVLGIINKDKK